MSTSRRDEWETPRAKCVPPAPARHQLHRPAVLAALDEASSRRLVLLSAGPGFGKTTALAEWARTRGVVWYTVDSRDHDIGAFAAGLLATLRRHVPIGDSPVGALSGPQASTGSTAEASAAAIGEMLEHALDRDITIVVDDCDHLPANGPAAGLLESLCRQAPDRLHLVLAFRDAPVVRAQRLRGRGMVADLDATRLAFTMDETAALLTAVLGASAAELAPAAHELTRGWPAAVRMLAEALHQTPPPGRAARLAELSRPGGVLVDYLADEVIGGADPPVRELLRATSGLPGFTASICRTAGVEVDAPELRRLACRGLLVRVDDGEEPTFRVPPLLVAAVRTCLPPPDPDTARALHATAVRSFTRLGRHADALRTIRLLDDRPALVDYLSRYGEALLAAGEVAAVADAADSVADEQWSPDLFRIAGQARQVRGDWQGALTCFRRAADGAEVLPAGLAWRMGLIYYFRGELDAAIDVFGRGGSSGDDAEHAHLLSWTAAAYWLRQEHDKCRQTARRALEVAVASGDDPAIAAAHTTLGMVAAMDGDQAADIMHYTHARRAAERAGDVLALMRIRNNIGSSALEDGSYRAAAVEFEEVIRLAEITGYASVLAFALHNRGLANTGLGRLDEAIADLSTALRSLRELASRMAAYPLMRLGDVNRLRGESQQARAAYELAVAEADAAGDAQGMIPALAGLARMVADEDPAGADDLLQRALACGPGISQVEAQLAAGWIALARGQREVAADWAHRAVTTSRTRRIRPKLAEAIELAVLAADPPRREAARLGEAATLWRGMQHTPGQAVNAYLQARLYGQPTASAEHRLRALGIRVAGVHHAPGQLRCMAVFHPPATVAVRTLGGFLVLRDGVPVPPDRWRSKKAREALKILIARRGRAVSRDVLADALWPDEPPERVSNRLSVALSTLRAVLDPARCFPSDHYVRADKDSIALRNLDVDVLSFLAASRDGIEHLTAGQADSARTVLAAAEAAYTGDFLDDDPYAEWAITLREEARATYLHVTRALAKLAAKDGDTDQTVRYLLRLLERDPYDEGAHLQLVDALRTAGKHGEARRRYRTYVGRMAELDIEPASFPP